MKETLINAAFKRIGKKPLKRLEWVADFSQRELTTAEQLAKAELELTCFLYVGLQDHPGLPISNQINALMTEAPWTDYSHKGREIIQAAQGRFTQVLLAAASDKEVEIPLRYLKVVFTRKDGVEYVPVIPGRVGQSASVLPEAKLEAVTFKLLRLLDKTVRTNLAGAKRGERLTPVRLYVGVCPKDRDGCGKLFAKARFDQDYCSRTCVSRAQVYRLRRKKRAAKLARGKHKISTKI